MQLFKSKVSFVYRGSQGQSSCGLKRQLRSNSSLDSNSTTACKRLVVCVAIIQYNCLRLISKFCGSALEAKVEGD